jgi:hypothetical protein
MRTIISIVAICLLSACKVSVEPAFSGVDCTVGFSRHGDGTSCAPIENTTPSVAVISIEPSHVYADSADALCYQFSPSPAAVRMGGSYYFQNNTGSTITIVGSNGIPWVSVAPGRTSATLYSNGAGIYAFGIAGCRGVAGPVSYGELDVTLN